MIQRNVFFVLFSFATKSKLCGDFYSNNQGIQKFTCRRNVYKYMGDAIAQVIPSAMMLLAIVVAPTVRLFVTKLLLEPKLKE